MEFLDFSFWTSHKQTNKKCPFIHDIIQRILMQKLLGWAGIIFRKIIIEFFLEGIFVDFYAEKKSKERSLAFQYKEQELISTKKLALIILKNSK